MGELRRTSFWRGIPSDWAVRGIRSSKRAIRIMGNLFLGIFLSSVFLARISRITRIFLFGGNNIRKKYAEFWVTGDVF